MGGDMMARSTRAHLCTSLRTIAPSPTAGGLLLALPVGVALGVAAAFHRADLSQWLHSVPNRGQCFALLLGVGCLAGAIHRNSGASALPTLPILARARRRIEASVMGLIGMLLLAVGQQFGRSVELTLSRLGRSAADPVPSHWLAELLVGAAVIAGGAAIASGQPPRHARGWARGIAVQAVILAASAALLVTAMTHLEPPRLLALSAILGVGLTAWAPATSSDAGLPPAASTGPVHRPPRPPERRLLTDIPYNLLRESRTPWTIVILLVGVGLSVEPDPIELSGLAEWGLPLLAASLGGRYASPELDWLPLRRWARALAAVLHASVGLVLISALFVLASRPWTWDATRMARVVLAHPPYFIAPLLLLLLLFPPAISARVLLRETSIWPAGPAACWAFAAIFIGSLVGGSAREVFRATEASGGWRPGTIEVLVQHHIAPTVLPLLLICGGLTLFLVVMGLIQWRTLRSRA